MATLKRRLYRKNSSGTYDIVYLETDASIITGTLPVSHGGTGATTAANARSNLGITPANIGAAASSHNHSASNITSGTLPVTRGGTGNTTGLAASATKLATARTIRTNLGSTSAASFNGTANITPGVSGVLPVSNGGTGVTNLNDLKDTVNKGLYELIDYTGTGLYGVNNPCQITVSKAPFIWRMLTDVYGYMNNSGNGSINTIFSIFLKTDSPIYGFCSDSYNTRRNLTTVSSDGKTLSWYNSDSAQNQFNGSGVKYILMIIF